MSARATSLELCKLSSRGARRVTPRHGQMVCVSPQTEGPLCTGPGGLPADLTEAPRDPRVRGGGEAGDSANSGRCTRSGAPGDQRLPPDPLLQGSPLGRRGLSGPASPVGTRGGPPQRRNTLLPQSCAVTLCPGGCCGRAQARDSRRSSQRKDPALYRLLGDVRVPFPARGKLRGRLWSSCARARTRSPHRSQGSSPTH